MVHNRNGGNRSTGSGNGREGKYWLTAFCAQAFAGIQCFPAADCKNHIGLLHLRHSREHLYIFVAGFSAEPDIINYFKPGAVNCPVNFRTSRLHGFVAADGYNFFAIWQTEFWNVIVNFRPDGITRQQHAVVLHNNPSKSVCIIILYCI